MQQPLSYRLRPETIDEFIGLENLLSCNTFLKNCVKNNCLFSMIFYGAPGSGKTTLAIVLANEVNERYRILNATTNNKKDLDIVFEEAKMFDLKVKRAEITKQITKMLDFKDIFEAYNQFLKSYYNLSYNSSKKIRFEDAIALLYIKQYEKRLGI